MIRMPQWQRALLLGLKRTLINDRKNNPQIQWLWNRKINKLPNVILWSDRLKLDMVVVTPKMPASDWLQFTKKQSLRIEWRRWNYQRQGGSGDVSMFEVYSMDAIRNNLYVETTNKHDEARKKIRQDSVKCIMKNLWIHFWKSQKCLLSSTNVDLRTSQ